MRDGLHDIAIIRIISEEEDEMDDEEDDDEFIDDNENESDDDEDEENEDEVVVDKDDSKSNNKNKSNVQRYNKKQKKQRRGRRNIDISLEDEIAKEPEHGGRSFPYLTMGNAEFCKVGDYVLAIGNNLGFHGTVTDGIISAIGRTNDERLPIAYPQFPLIQTNASINPGSSGGALVNMKGELIGINESIATSTGGNVGVGFAVPVNFLRPLLRSSMKKSFYDIERVWDGISPMSCPIAILPNDEGLSYIFTHATHNQIILAQKMQPHWGLNVYFVLQFCFIFDFCCCCWFFTVMIQMVKQQVQQSMVYV